MRRRLEEQRQRLIALAHVWIAISLNPFDHPYAVYDLHIGHKKSKATRLVPRA